MGSFLMVQVMALHVFQSQVISSTKAGFMEGIITLYYIFYVFSSRFRNFKFQLFPENSVFGHLKCFEHKQLCAVGPSHWERSCLTNDVHCWRCLAIDGHRWSVTPSCVVLLHHATQRFTIVINTRLYLSKPSTPNLSTGNPVCRTWQDRLRRSQSEFPGNPRVTSRNQMQVS